MATHSKLPPEIEREYREYSKITTSADPLIIILKSHLLTEYYLEQIIIAYFPAGNVIIDEAQLTYYQKALLVESFGDAPKELLSCLKKLNKVRNSCAHKKDYEIRRGDIDSIGSPLAAGYLNFKKRFPDDDQSLLSHVIGAICAQMAGLVTYYEELARSRHKEDA